MSVIGFAEPGAADQPSPAIWGDCPNQLLNDKGLGYFLDERFAGAALTTTAADGASLGKDVRLANGTGNVAITDASLPGGGITVATANADNDQAVVAGPALGPIVRNSGKKLWFEAIVAPGDVDADMATFVGLIEPAGVTAEVVADDVGTDCLVTESAIGFLQDNEDDDAYKIVYRKDAGAVVTVLANATQAGGIPEASRTDLADGEYHKLGIYFNGRDTLSFYVDGYKVASIDVDSTIDQVKDYVPVIAIKTGTTAAETISIRRLRAGYQVRT